MKKILKFAAIAATAFALLSCEKTPEGSNNNSGSGNNKPGTTDEPTLTEDIEFELEVTKLESDEAKIKVTHNGTKTETWYGFVTTANDPDDAFEDKLDELMELIDEGEKIEDLKKGKSKTITVDELEPETDYYYIVFAMTSEGEYYGEYNYIDFTTPEEVIEIEGYVENPAWTVAYSGPQDLYGDGEICETATVTSTDQNSYFLTAWPKNYFTQTPIEDIVEGEIEYMVEMIDELNKYYGSRYTFADVLSTGTSTQEIVIETEYGNEWYAIAIGADGNGNATGLYAVSPLITITEPELTEGYASWLGTWKFTGSNNVSQTVTFSKAIANSTYKMTGYEGSSTDGLNVRVNWYEEYGEWAIFNQKLGTYTFTIDEKGSKANGDIWFVGETAEEDLYLSAEVPICVGHNEGGVRMAEGYSTSWEDEDTGATESYVVDHMVFLAYFESFNELSYITDTYKTGFPSFPITITPVTKTLSLEKDFIGASTQARFDKSFKPFKAYDFNKSARIR